MLMLLGEQENLGKSLEGQDNDTQRVRPLGAWGYKLKLKQEQQNPDPTVPLSPQTPSYLTCHSLVIFLMLNEEPQLFCQI